MERSLKYKRQLEAASCFNLQIQNELKKKQHKKWPSPVVSAPTL
jgi:hypothetical protein